MRSFTRSISSLCFLVIICGCGSAEVRDDAGDVGAFLDDIRKNLPSLDLLKSVGSPENNSIKDEKILRYFDYYDLDTTGVEHLFGGMRIGKQTIAVHVFLAGQPLGTVLTVHGYYDHTGVLKHLIRHLVGESYTVLAFDFPGHGLSGGAPGDIEDFSEYLAVFSRLMDDARAVLPAPVHVVAHSMGAGVVTEYLLTGKGGGGERFVLVSPNIRLNMWSLSRAAYFLISPFADSLRRGFLASSHDKEFLEWRRRHDPLQVRSIPVRWFEKLVEWNARMIDYSGNETPVLVIQGTSDNTVDFKYNIDFLEKRFPNLKLNWIEGGEHHLLNEAPAMREEVFGLITAYLRSD